MQHQRKLESEIQLMEDNFNSTKKRILDRSATFQEQINKFIGPPPTKQQIVAGEESKPSPSAEPDSPVETAETPQCESMEDQASPVLPQVDEKSFYCVPFIFVPPFFAHQIHFVAIFLRIRSISRSF